MDRLEERMSEIYEVIKSLDARLDKILTVEEPKVLGSVSPEPMIMREGISEISRAPDRLPNPWAVEAARNLMDSRSFRRMIKESYETYRPTIEALEAASSWVTTEEVSKCTGKKRNTESAYLKRLSNANLIERKREGKKVLYRLKDRKSLNRVFGMKH